MGSSLANAYREVGTRSARALAYADVWRARARALFNQRDGDYTSK